ncbi:MAG: glutamine synthetase III [Sedimentisphaerales bacterium]|nr:glutamine synthetase III [Sedimentisphaerales bacterium]
MKDTPTQLQDIFGSNVFSEAVMRSRLPKNVYQTLKKAIEGEESLSPTIADVIANAMKDWAIEKGATHFCHWFQPMTGLTAEKHDSFISPTPEGKTIMEFSGKELIKGEPDASSFPSGGLRATFEARGYTAWDCTSPVFVKSIGKNTALYIPCAFCSYTGEALDKKTPLLRSMEALNRQAMRVLKALGNTTSKRVLATLGSEQEYFLIDRKFHEKRLDLLLAGRTLFGAPSPRGQELEDHYFGTLDERVASFMNELNLELWKLGVPAKTQHNEVAPAQYEIAPVFGTVNVATDHNQLVMESLRRVAARHGFMCLLHEKPFSGVNGSGKHNNWSMVTDDGINLLDPGHTPHENMMFLVFLCSIVRAVDKYAKLLRASVATAGNEHRLGANEAPPAIVSVFLGDQLTDIFEQLATGEAKSSKSGGQLKLGVSTLPPLPKDSTDRNRTSPFAFTGNKFEFRMVGSTQSTSGPMFVMNTIAADVLAEVADTLEKAKDINAETQKLLTGFAKEHRRVVFNGDNYTAAWAEEAAKRGLPNIASTVESLKTITEPLHGDVFERHCVLSKGELHARAEILLEAYARQILIEAKTTSTMARRDILPACITFSARLAQAVGSVTSAGGDAAGQKVLLTRVCRQINTLQTSVDALDKAIENVVHGDAGAHAAACREKLIPAMAAVREAADQLEKLVDADLWPLPTYPQMLFMR